MPRPDLSAEKRTKFLPRIAGCFAEHGYRRTTTAELAAACGVQEPILYRLWPGKKEMFLAAIEYVAELSSVTWRTVVDGEGSGTRAERLLAYESTHLGEFGLYRILFAGLSEADDPEIGAALRRTFLRFHEEIRTRIEEHREGEPGGAVAWAVIGLGLLANLGRDLDLFAEEERRSLIAEMGRFLLEGRVR